MKTLREVLSEARVVPYKLLAAAVDAMKQVISSRIR
jgi:hypothetical protein